MSVLDSYWSYRKTKMRLKRPELAFLEVMFGMVSSKTGRPTSFFEGVKGMYQLGKYHQQQNMDSIKRMLARLMPKNDFEARGPTLSDAEWENLGKGGTSGPDRSEAGLDGGPDPAPRPDFGDTARDPLPAVVPPERAFRTGDDPNFRAWITPDRAGNKVPSNEVPSTRRIPLYDGPWPVDGPPGQRRSETSELAISAGRGKTERSARLMLESPVTAAERDEERRARDVHERARRRLAEINGEAPESGDRAARVRERARARAEKAKAETRPKPSDRGSERE